MIEIPDWLAKIHKNACVNIDEFSKLICVGKTAIQWRYSNDVYSTQKPDFNSRVTKMTYLAGSHLTHTYSKGKGKNHWRAVTVRNYIRLINRLELEKRKLI